MTTAAASNLGMGANVSELTRDARASRLASEAYRAGLETARKNYALTVNRNGARFSARPDANGDWDAGDCAQILRMADDSMGQCHRFGGALTIPAACFETILGERLAANKAAREGKAA